MSVDAQHTTRITGGDIAETYRVALEDGLTVFVKRYRDGPANQCEREAQGLRWIDVGCGLRVPRVLGFSTGTAPMLMLEWIERAPPCDRCDEQLGRAVAALHSTPAPSFGLEHDNMIGSLPQDNGPCGSWSEFFVLRRIEPLIRRAHGAGLLSPDDLARLDALLSRVSDLCGDPGHPVRIHGDLWSGNVMHDARGMPVLIDPAPYGADREMDIAMMHLFGGLGPRCFAAYEEIIPARAGATDRTALYQLYPLLVHLVLFGSGYRTRVMAIPAHYGI